MMYLINQKQANGKQKLFFPSIDTITMIIMISHVTLCRGFGCELKKVRKMRLGPTCQGLLSQEAAFQAK